MRAIIAVGPVVGMVLVHACSSSGDAPAPGGWPGSSGSSNDASIEADTTTADQSSPPQDATVSDVTSESDAAPLDDGGTANDGAANDSTSNDSGSDADATQGDTGAGDGSTDDGGIEASAPPVAPWVLWVNASPDFGAMGLCFSTSVLTPNVPPEVVLPQNAGGATFYTDPPPYNSVDLTALAVTLYAVPSAAFQTSDGSVAGCADLIANSQAVALGTVPAGALAHGAAYVLAATGCVANDPSASGCGADYDGGAANLALQIEPLDNTTAFDAGIGVQFVQASTPWEGAAIGTNGSYGGTVVAISDGGPTTLLGPASFGAGAAPTTALESAPLGGTSASLVTTARLGGDAGPSALSFTSTIAQVQAASFGFDDAGAPVSPQGGFLATGNWAFILVGDPIQPPIATGNPNPLFSHLIALPNQP